jgi:hypothetical protein
MKGENFDGNGGASPYRYRIPPAVPCKEER